MSDAEKKVFLIDDLRRKYFLTCILYLFANTVSRLMPIISHSYKIPQMMPFVTIARLHFTFME